MKSRITAWLACGSLITLCIGCAPNARVATTLNHDATLPAQVLQPLQGTALTSWVDPAHSTMSTLFANQTAAAYARTHSDSAYPAGSALTVVTWKQQEDARWFGGRIPAKPESVERLEVIKSADGSPSYRYRKFAGDPLSTVAEESSAAANPRIVQILSFRAAVMP